MDQSWREALCLVHASVVRQYYPEDPKEIATVHALRLQLFYGGEVRAAFDQTVGQNPSYTWQCLGEPVRRKVLVLNP